MEHRRHGVRLMEPLGETLYATRLGVPCAGCSAWGGAALVCAMPFDVAYELNDGWVWEGSNWFDEQGEPPELDDVTRLPPSLMDLFPAALCPPCDVRLEQEWVAFMAHVRGRTPRRGDDLMDMDKPLRPVDNPPDWNGAS